MKCETMIEAILCAVSCERDGCEALLRDALVVGYWHRELRDNETLWETTDTEDVIRTARAEVTMRAILMVASTLGVERVRMRRLNRRSGLSRERT